MRRGLLVTLGALLALALAACESETADPAPAPADGPIDPTEEVAVPTWYGAAGPIIEARCGNCHTAEGIGPFALTNYAEVTEVAQLVAYAVSSGTMPPMPPDTDNCRPLSDHRIMPESEREQLLAWIDGGMPEGDPSEAPTEPLPLFADPDPLGPPDYTHDFGFDYTSPTDELVNGGTTSGSTTGNYYDDYRCLIVDPGWTEWRHLRAIGVQPDNASIVHHVIAYLQLPEHKDTVDALVAADSEGPGYECFGGPGFEGAIQIAGFAPGAPNLPFVGDRTVTLPPGSRFIVQMHYNFAAGTGADRTKLLFWETDDPTPDPPKRITLANLWFKIPAGDEHFTTTAKSVIIGADEVPAHALQQTPGLAWGISAHMHNLGKSISIELVRKDGTRECLLDIPKWDFDWQGAYMFREPLELHEGDRLNMTCTWDNSADNQAVIDGVQVEPRDVEWGESSFDEMCLGSVLMTDFPSTE